jgi:predicted PurR-regulated permease PerM
LALSIAIIYTVALIVRQIVEPKILSNQTGIHPLLSLLGMYAGLNLLGVWGIIVGPVTVLLINSMLKGGLIKITAKKA